MANDNPQAAPANDNPFGDGGVDMGGSSGDKPAETPTTAPAAPPQPAADTPPTTTPDKSATEGTEPSTPDNKDEEIRDPAAKLKATEEKYQRLLNKSETSLREANDQIAKLTDKVNKLEGQQAEDLQKEIAELKASVKKEQDVAEAARLETLRVKIGVELGVPSSLIDRLQGTTEADIKADAEKIMADLPKPQPGGKQTRVLGTGGLPAPDDLSWFTQRGQADAFGGGGVQFASGDEE